MTFHLRGGGGTAGTLVVVTSGVFDVRVSPSWVVGDHGGSSGTATMMCTR
ncbi:hypothetical protein [Akkermansia muciniphila]|nr:hypothetical protein [Akkermansia muciniphila]